jgi:hypothetical protein
MPKVRVTSQIAIDLDEVLQGLARLGSKELEQFVEKIIALQAQGRDGAITTDIQPAPAEMARPFLLE